MSLGGGLNSLIPPKQGGASRPSPAPQEPPPSAPQRQAPTLPSVPPLQASSFTRDPFSRVTAHGAHEDERGSGSRRNPPVTDHAPRSHGGGTDSVFQIEIEKIRPNPYQPRREFEPQALRELAQSIRDFGILQPLVVTKSVLDTATGTDVEYQLIAGERRLQAAKLAGLERVPAIIRRVDERRTKLELALIENIQRSDLSAVEAARAYARLQDEFGLTQREVAARVGKSREVVANALRLLSLPVPVQQALAERKINESQARTLLALSSAEAQLAALDAIVNRKLSVRALKRDLLRESPAHDPKDAFHERRLEERIGAPVSISRDGGKGKITVQFYSEEELQGIVGRLIGDETR